MTTNKKQAKVKVLPNPKEKIIKMIKIFVVTAIAALALTKARGI